MPNRIINIAAVAILTTALALLIVACSDSEAGMSRADVEDVVRSELASQPAPPEPGASVAEVERIVQDSIADIPEPPLGITSAEVEEIVRDFIGDIPEPTIGVTSDEVERIVRDSIADIPQPSPELSSQDVERIVQAAIADIPAPAAMMKPEETKLAVAPPKSTPDAYTQYLVKEAISRYKSDGLDATVTYYNTPESIDGQWYVFIGDENDMMLAHAANPDLVGQPFSYATGPNAYPAGSAVAASADEDGEWFSYTFPNPATGGVETKHSWMVRYDGLVFGTGWYEAGPAKSDAPAYTQSFVRRAIALYDAVGLDETVAYYNMPESIDGQWYIFIGDEEDTLIAHPANPSLVGVPAVEVKGPNAYPSGAAVAAVADQDGEWFSYTFPNPATGGVETKHSWMIRYDGLTFGSGWYEDGPAKSDAPAYTQSFVRQAIALYDAVGLDDTVAYYNMPESIDDQWYIFIGDEEDMMLAHAADPDLVGNPFSYAIGPNAYPAGSAVAASADQDGEWFSYTFPNPATGGVETKHSWMVRYDGLLFGSGWYEDGPAKSDSPAYTQAFVRQAIALYDAVGLEETVSYYNMPESVDGQWYVFIGDEEDMMLAHAADPDLVGNPFSYATGPNAYPAGSAVAAVADQDGEWFSYTFPNPATGGVETKHSWMVRYDGLLFGSGWYEDGPAKSNAPAYTKAVVQQAIALYNAVGLDDTIAYYNNPESVDGQWYVFVIDGDGYTISHHNPMFIGRDPALRVDSTGHFYGDELTGATEAGRWVDYVLINPETGAEQQKHTWAVRHDGLIFGSGWYEE